MASPPSGKDTADGARLLQAEDLVHPGRHVGQPLLVAAPDLGGGPAVVADLGQRLEYLGPVLATLADADVEPLPLALRGLRLLDAVAFEVELEHPLAELA